MWLACYHIIETVNMPIETEEQFRRRGRELERTRESRESREAESDEELKAGAAMERADFLVKEVKQSKQQMQNIVLHMQQVTDAIRKLRQELALADSGGPASVARDKKRIDALKEKIKAYRREILDMREDLIREQAEELKKSGFTENANVLRGEAERLVEELMNQITDSK
jgi:hypothetical protein